jgi:hypothetical protein
MEQQKTYAEEIVRKIKESSQPEKTNAYAIENDIHNGYVIVKYKKLDIEERKIMDGSLTMMLPSEFQLMEESLARAKYPDDDRPDYIYTNQDTTVNITFSTDNSGIIDDEEVEEVKNILKNQIKRIYPGTKMEDSQPLKADKKNVSYFFFEIPLIDGNLFQLMFFMEHKKQLVMGAFNCGIYQKKQWKPLILQMLKTLKEIKENE